MATQLEREQVLEETAIKQLHWYEQPRTLSIILGSAETPVEELRMLREIETERRRAGYDRGERLQELVFYGGRWSSDACGNMMTAMHPIPTEIVDQASKVMTKDNYWRLVQRIDPDFRLSSALEGALPAGLCCAECRKPWDINTAHEYRINRLSETVSLEKYEGMTLGEAAKSIAHQHSETQIWALQSDCMYRNDKNVDSRPDPEFPNLQVNAGGWIRGSHTDHIIEPGDQAWFNIWEFRHPDCERVSLESKAGEYYLEVATAAGFDVGAQNATCTMMAEPNSYHPNATESWPWARLTTPWGDIVFGWRKRVITIHLEFDGLNLETLFSQEDVTKGEHLIHAWGKEKAIEYLTRIREQLEQPNLN